MPTSFTSPPKTLKVVPDGMKLRRYQKEGVKRIVSQARTLLADEPGLGKTCQALVASNIWRNPAIVIVCPACITLNWEKEFRMWDIHNREVLIVGDKVKKYSGEPVVVVSYESQKKVFPLLKDLLATSSATTPSLLIADEFHYAKN